MCPGKTCSYKTNILFDKYQEESGVSWICKSNINSSMVQCCQCIYFWFCLIVPHNDKPKGHSFNRNFGIWLSSERLASDVEPTNIFFFCFTGTTTTPGFSAGSYHLRKIPFWVDGRVVLQVSGICQLSVPTILAFVLSCGRCHLVLRAGYIGARIRWCS